MQGLRRSSQRTRGWSLGIGLATLLLGLATVLFGWGRARANWNVEGTWRSARGMILTARLLPDGTLVMIDKRGIKHPFRRVGPNLWEARISRVARGSIRREGNQLVFRREPTEEAKRPLAEKDGLVIARQIRSVEDRMTRLTDPVGTPSAPADPRPAPR
jgi:hypothetical protein